jgi:hypothetical protein
MKRMEIYIKIKEERKIRWNLINTSEGRGKVKGNDGKKTKEIFPLESRQQEERKG